MRKVLPWIIIVWPYLMFPWGYCLIVQSDPFPLFVFAGSSLILFLASIITIFLRKDPDSSGTLAFWGMVTKLSHIPFYIILFFIATMTIAAPVVILFAVIFDSLLLITTSAYGIKALILTKEKALITTPFLIVNGIAHLFFILDVFSAVVLYLNLRKQAKIQAES